MTFLPFLLNRSRLRSEEHTSELQSHLNLVCRLLLEKKKNNCSLLIHTHDTHAHQAQQHTHIRTQCELRGRMTRYAQSTPSHRERDCFFFFLIDRAPPEFSTFSLPADLPI